MKAKGGASISEDVMDAMVDDVKAQLLPHIRNFNREFLAVNERTYDEITTDYENIILNKFLGKTKKNPSSYISKEEKARIKGNWVENILKKNKLTYEEAVQSEIKNLSAEDRKLFDIIKKLEIVESESKYGTKQMFFDPKDLLNIEGTIPQEVYDKLYDYKVVENESLSAWINSVVKFKTFKAFENQTGEFEFNQDISDITKNVPRSEEGFFNDFTYEDQYKFIAEKDKFNEESLRVKLNISDKLKEDIRQSVLKDMKMKLLGDELRGESTAFTNINIKKASEALREIERLESGVEVIEGVTIKKLSERAKLIGFQVKIFNKEIKEFKQSIQKKFENSYLDYIRKELFGAVDVFNDEGQITGLSIKKNIEAYEKFLNENFKVIYDKLSITTLNEKYKKDKKGEILEFEFVEKLSEKMTTHESIKQKVMNIHAGNDGWRKLELSELTEIRDGEEVLKQEVLDYFLKPKRSNLNERARGLANAISTELAFDAVMEVFRSEDFQKSIPERPEGIVGNEIDIVSKALLRDPNLRFMNTVNEVLGYPVEAFEGIAMESFGDVFDRNLKLTETLDVVLNEIVENRYSYDEAKQKIKDDHQGVVEYLNDYNSGIFEGPDNAGLTSKTKTILKKVGSETAQGKLLASAVHSHNPREAAKLISGFMENLTLHMPEALVGEIQNSVLRNRDRKINEKGIPQGSADSMFAFSSSDKYGLDRRAKRYVSKENDPNVIKYRKNVKDAKKGLNNSPYVEGSARSRKEQKDRGGHGNRTNIAKTLLKEKLITREQSNELQTALDKALGALEGWKDYRKVHLSDYLNTGEMPWATDIKEFKKAWNNLDKVMNKLIGEDIVGIEKGTKEYKDWISRNKNTIIGRMEINNKWSENMRPKGKYSSISQKVKGQRYNKRSPLEAVVENYEKLLNNFKELGKAYKNAKTPLIMKDGRVQAGDYYGLYKGFFPRFKLKSAKGKYSYIRDVMIYDTNTGIGRSINTIRNKNIPVEQRRKELDKLTADILKANNANKKLFADILNSHYELLLNSKKADFQKNWLGWVEFMKSQIVLQDGLKSLSSLDFIEISKDPKMSYNEHVVGFSNTVSRLFDVFSRGLADNMSWENIQKSVRDVISDNSSAFVSKETAKMIIDPRFGQTSDIGSLRLYAIEGLKDLYVVGSKAKNETQRKKEIQEYVIAETYKRGIVKKEAQAAKKNVKETNKSNVVRVSKSATNEEVLSLAATMDAALDIARNPNSPVKKIRVFDFDDTLAKTKSNVLYTMPDGTKGKLTAEEFAKKGSKMVAEGAVLDFSEFNKVVDGKKGPLFEIAEAIQNKRGAKDIFILTARSPEAAKAIHEFLNNAGLNIPLENITGLGDSSPFAKSKWVIEKAAEGYNDFYFADDHAKNVEAVQDALDQIQGLKTRTQVALPQGKVKSEPLNKKQVDAIEANSMRDIDNEASSDGYSNVRFSKSHRVEYEKMLEKRRPDLKGQIPEQVNKVFEFVDSPGVPENKKTKFEKLALHYLSKGFLILPEDGYKVVEAERLASAKKIDPFSFSNPNEIIEKFAGEVKGKRINPSTMSALSNKRSLEYGITIYDVANTREAQQQVRSIIDTHWGKKSNPWCLAARTGPYDASGKRTMGEQAWEHWENYGEEKQIAFKDGKLVAFRDGDAKQWWDKLDRPSYEIEVRGSVEKTEKSKNAQGDEVKTKTRFIYRIDPETGVKEKGNKEVISTYKNKDGENVSDATITKGLPPVLHQALGKNLVISTERKVNGKKDGKQHQLYLEENAYLDLISFLEEGGAVVSRDRKYEKIPKKGEHYTLEEIKQAPMDIYYDAFPTEAFEIWDKGNMVERKNVQGYNIHGNRVKYQDLVQFRGDVKKTTTYEIKRSVENDNNIWRDTKIVVEEKEGKVNNIYELSKSFGASGVTIKKNNYKVKFNKDGVIYRELNGRKFLTEYDIFMRKVLASSLAKDTNLTESVGWYWNDTHGGSIGNARNVLLAKTIWDKVKVEKEGVKKSWGAILEVEGLKDKNFKDWAFDRFNDNKPMKVEDKIVVGKEVKLVGKKAMKRERLMQGLLEDILFAKKTSLENQIVPLDKNLKPTSRFSMETKMDLEWKKTEKPGPEWEKEPSIGYKAEFNIKDNKFTISMGRMFESESLAQVNHISGRDDITELKGDYYVLDFAFIDAEGKPRVDMTGIMGPEGGKVLSIVANGVVDFVRKNKNIKGLYFSSAIDKRTRIYKAMARTFGNELDWGYKSKKEDALWGETDLIVSADIPVRKNLSGQRKPVRDVLSVIDKSSNTQQARFSETIDLNKIMNQMIEDKTGIPAEKTFDQLAKSIGRKKGRGKIFMPYSTEDFKGLIYPLISSGKVGDAQLKLMNEVLFKPFNRAMNNVSRDRMQVNADFKELKRNLKSVPKNLTKEAIPESGLTYENVVRLYLWDKQGIEIEGVNAETMKNVWEIMQEKPELQAFADQLMNINKGDGYYYPGELWLTGNMTSDLYSGINKVKRKKYLAEWKRNKDIMFSKDNMLKLEAAYGPKYVESLRDILRRMETGVNRPEKSSRFEDMAMNYINGSVGVTMFFNTRSAILQTISTANYINWSDNNLYNVGKAYANAPQFAKDFLYLMKSDFMKDRRSGLKINVSESEIADAAKKKGYRGVLNLLLQSGFSLTKAGDAFAIAFGGAPFYRNRVKTYEKQGFDKAEAEKKAFEDFRELTEESQQSARTDKISMQQADKWGRIILAFANTPMQYNRLIKRSAQDLIKGRGDWKSHTSRIVYYLGVQNLIFNALQRALFAMEGDLDSDENKDRYYEVGNGMLDSILRGSGYGGALISVLKNFGAEMHEQSKKDRPQYRDAWIELLGIAPPVQAKIKRLQQAGKTLDYNQRTAEEMGWKFSLDNPNYQSAASWISGATNIPLDRLMRKADNVSQVLNDDWENWQKVMMVLGWNKWELETADQKEKMEEEKAKTTKRRRKETYEKNKAEKKRKKSKANAAMGLITN